MSNAPTLRIVPRLSGTTGERIKSARGFHRWKQDDLLRQMRAISSEHTPVRKTLSNWENDHKSPTVAEIQIVARATGFPVEQFVNDLSDGPGPGRDGGRTSEGPAAEYAPWDSNPEPADCVIVPLTRRDSDLRPVIVSPAAA